MSSIPTYNLAFDERSVGLSFFLDYNLSTRDNTIILPTTTTAKRMENKDDSTGKTQSENHKKKQQRTLVSIEIKPYDVEQDLIALWKKITQTITQDGMKWGESCTLAKVAYGIQKIQCTFTMGDDNSSDDIADSIITTYEDEVQSCDITSMTVL